MDIHVKKLADGSFDYQEKMNIVMDEKALRMTRVRIINGLKHIREKYQAQIEQAEKDLASLNAALGIDEKDETIREEDKIRPTKELPSLPG